MARLAVCLVLALAAVCLAAPPLGSDHQGDKLDKGGREDRGGQGPDPNPGHEGPHRVRRHYEGALGGYGGGGGGGGGYGGAGGYGPGQHGGLGGGAAIPLASQSFSKSSASASSVSGGGTGVLG